MPNYELTYILRPVDEVALNALNERIANFISSSGGEISARNDWGKRRFAFPIRKISEGYYVSLKVTLPPQAVRAIERALQLNDEVLRYLVVRVDEHETVRPEAQRS